MKKVFSIFSILVTILVLSACTEPEPVYIEVPGPTEYVEVIKEVEVEVPVVETVIKTVTEVVTETIEVPINVDYERFYKPGVYLNHTKINSDGVYTYAVVIVDNYGKIAGIMFDDTKSESEFYIDDEDNLYVFVEGDGKSVPHTYRYVPSDIALDEYPTVKDAITADDLVMGIHQDEIDDLTQIQTNETSRILGEEWVQYTDLLANKIIEDQTTYGISLYKSGNEVTTNNVAGVELTNVDLYIDLVQEVLDNDASEPDLDTLKTVPEKGLYTPGGRFGSSKRIIGESIFYYTSFVAVDEFGKIAGVYNDATATGYDDDEHSTRWILEDDYDGNEDVDWYLQAQAFGKAITRNQGVDGFDLFKDTDYDTESTFPIYSKGGFNFEYDGVVDENQEHVYTDQVPGTTIGIEGFLVSTKDALSKFPAWEFKDGTYFVKGEGDEEHSFAAVVIEDGKIGSVFIDSTVETDQAEVYIDIDGEDDWFSLYKFDRITTDGSEQKVTTVLAYKDGSSYRSLFDIDFEDDDDLRAGDKISLSDDEESTIEPISGYNTQLSLADISSSNEEYNEQLYKFMSYFEGKDTPYDINIDNGHTDSIEDVNIDIEDYHQLMVNALALAKDDGNALMGEISFTSSAPKLANGTYFASLEPNKDGEQPFAFMSVVENEIQSIIFDSTVKDGNQITTKLSLGDDYGLKDDVDDLEWYEQSVLLAKEIIKNQDDIIEDIEDGTDTFDYEEDGEFGVAPYYGENPTVDLDDDDDITINVENFKYLTDKLVQQALRGIVKERAEEILNSIEVETDYNGYLIAGKQYEHNLDTDLEFGSNDYEFELTWDTSDDDYIVVPEDTIGYEDYIEIPDDVDKDVTESLIIMLEYDDVEYTREIEFNILSPLTAEIKEIEQIIENDYKDLKILEGHDFNLQTKDLIYVEIDPDEEDVDYEWQWYDEDGDLIHNTIDLLEGTHTLTLRAEYDDNDYIKKYVTIEIVDVDDAFDEVVDNLTPGNIIDNGDVTKEGVIDLQFDSGYKGIEITWSMDNNPDGVEFDDVDNKLTMTRTYDNEKVELTATVVNEVEDETEILSFDFRVLAADAELVEKRITEKLEEILSDPAKLPDSIVDTQEASTNSIIVKRFSDMFIQDNFLPDKPVFDWDVTDKNGNDIVGVDVINNYLRIDEEIEDETAYLQLEITVDIDDNNENDVKVERVFEIELFKSTIER